jgi:hypothetical protein
VAFFTAGFDQIGRHWFCSSLEHSLLNRLDIRSWPMKPAAKRGTVTTRSARLSSSRAYSAGAASLTECDYPTEDTDD